MSCACISNQKKIFISVQTAVIAFIIFNPIIFKVIRGIFGSWVSSVEGCPTMPGLLLHTLLFGFVIYLLMIKSPRQTSQNRQIQ